MGRYLKLLGQAGMVLIQSLRVSIMFHCEAAAAHVSTKPFFASLETAWHAETTMARRDAK